MSGNSGMEELIPIVNKLQNITTKAGFTLKLDLPQIAVVGGQSAGKSSVLENFVGRDFLPRGSGIVTRRPLILQLINNQHEYAEFLHKPGRKFTIPEIRNEIERETNKTIKENKGVSADPINLTIFSPNVLNLTLVDLPGLTKVPVGEQPPDIEDIIQEMILQFIRRDNCLILAVTPANSDLANSDALKLAKQVDPKGLRTIGVLTKLDLMDEGTNARDILENKVFPLQRGYIGVVSRSQKDIDEKKDIVNALNAEEQFFLKHPAYSQMAEKLGTSYLQRQLNQQLTIHIRKTLPAFRDELLKRLILVENEIEAYDDFQLNNSSEKTKAMFRMLQQLHSNFETAIGNYNFDNVKGEISIGSKIYRLFHYEFPSNIKKIKTNDKEMEKEIELSIMNARGVRAGLFTPDAAFSGPVKKQIKRFRNPSLKFIICATQEITNISLNCTESILHYPKLRERTEQNITSYIRHCEKKCKELFDTLMDLELAYMNTKHPDFNANINSYQNFTQDTDQNDTIIDTRMVKQVEAIKNCIDSYIKIVKKTMIDLVPKAIQHTVIDAVKNYIESDLLVDLTPNVDQLMVLSEEENCKRDEKLKLYETCKEALRIIDDVSMVCATKIASTTKLSNESP